MTRLERAKQKSIKIVLAQLGYTPELETGTCLAYKSMLPGRFEGQASLIVYKADNTWVDYGVGKQRRDIIDLISDYKSISCKEAINYLLSDEIVKDAVFQPPPKKDKANVVIHDVREIQSQLVYDYLVGRKISPHRARPYIKEVDIRFPYGKDPQRTYLTVGHYTDAGGMELRNSFLKTVSVSPKGITTYRGTSSAYNIFEGIFDFLSYLEYFNVDVLKHTCIILNGVSFIGGVAPFLQGKRVFCFSDNDPSGTMVYDVLKEEGVNVTDERHYYEMYRDFNDMLCGRKIEIDLEKSETNSNLHS